MAGIVWDTCPLCGEHCGSRGCGRVAFMVRVEPVAAGEEPVTRQGTMRLLRLREGGELPADAGYEVGAAAA